METIAKIALSMIPGLGPTGCRRLLELFPEADIFGLSAAEVRQAFGPVHKDVADAIVGKTTFARAEQELRFCEENGIRVLFCTDGDYPQRLNGDDTRDCPVVLYCLGKADMNMQRAVSVVGTRRATPHGREDTAELVGQMAPLGVTVVSGLAYGIDTAAHMAALEHGLPTVAVLGHGLDIIYPAANRNLAKRILECGGALLTEYPSGTAVNPGYFPARNRIVAALGDATVVVESSEKGGAMITAAIAGSYHREVMAVPGRIGDTCSMGTNNLIATNRAVMMRSATDLAYQMGWPLPTAREQGRQQELFDDLNNTERSVVKLLEDTGIMTLDEMVAASGMSTTKMASVMFDLELKKIVHAMPGRMYELVH